jgi:hypothetical protein
METRRSIKPASSKFLELVIQDFRDSGNLGGRNKDEKEIRALLIQAPFFSSHDTANDEYYYRGAQNLQGAYDMPDAYAKMCASGVELCAYGETEVVKGVWDFLLDQFKKRFGKVEIGY